MFADDAAALSVGLLTIKFGLSWHAGRCLPILFTCRYVPAQL